jgi:predicted membrane channel-forming protein YqfA (hemolysin III family)
MNRASIARRIAIGIALLLGLIVVIIFSAAYEQASGSKAPCVVVGGVTSCSK